MNLNGIVFNAKFNKMRMMMNKIALKGSYQQTKFLNFSKRLGIIYNANCIIADKFFKRAKTSSRDSSSGI